MPVNYWTTRRFWYLILYFTPEGLKIYNRKKTHLEKRNSLAFPHPHSSEPSGQSGSWSQIQWLGIHMRGSMPLPAVSFGGGHMYSFFQSQRAGTETEAVRKKSFQFLSHGFVVTEVKIWKSKNTDIMKRLIKSAFKRMRHHKRSRTFSSLRKLFLSIVKIEKLFRAVTQWFGRRKREISLKICWIYLFFGWLWNKKN